MFFDIWWIKAKSIQGFGTREERIRASWPNARYDAATDRYIDPHYGDVEQF